MGTGLNTTGPWWMKNCGVHGMSNLWVGDASIMPVVSHANSELTSIMIGERLSDFVKEVA